MAVLKRGQKAVVLKLRQLFTDENKYPASSKKCNYSLP